MGPIDCPETSVTEYHSTPSHTPEERRSIYNCLRYSVGSGSKMSGDIGKACPGV